MKDRSPRWRSLLFAILLGASLIANFALATKMVVFDEVYPLRPICFKESDGLVALDGRMTDQFKAELAYVYNSSARWAHSSWTLYVSRWYWWNKKELIWNHSIKAAENIHKKVTGGAPISTDPLRRSSTCRFIGKYALE